MLIELKKIKKIEELSKKILEGGIKEEDKDIFKNLKEQYDSNEKICENLSKSFSQRRSKKKW